MIVSSKKEALRMIVLYIDTIMRKASFLRLYIDTITHDSINTQYIEYTVTVVY